MIFNDDINMKNKKELGTHYFSLNNLTSKKLIDDS
jgi:hypothetical protein